MRLTLICCLRKSLSLFFLLCLLLPGSNGWCSEVSSDFSGDEQTQGGVKPAEGADSVEKLPPVVVVGTPVPDPTGVSTLSRYIIKALPSRAGGIAEVISVLPAVQLSDKAHSSLTGGEIAPPMISISGGKVFQNNFRVDGLSNNSLLDRIADNPSSASSVPGHPQLFFLDVSLFEEIRVFDSNVPARYGNFTGGVIDARTRKPKPEFGGRIHYRTTRDNWTRFQLKDGGEEEFALSGSQSMQPHFDIHEVGLDLDIPLGIQSGVLFSYSLDYSKVPLYLLGRIEDQTRRNDNLLFKYVHDFSASDSVDVSFTYAPYETDYFLRNVKDSRFSTSGGGGGINVGYKGKLFGGELEVRGGHTEGETSREAPQYLRTWKSKNGSVPTSKPWGTLVGSSNSSEGGFGDIDQTEKTFSLTTDWLSRKVQTGIVEHQANLGISLENSRAESGRKEDAITYHTGIFSQNLVCAEDDLNCVSGEQFLSKRNIYRAGLASAEIAQMHFYLDDQIQLGRLGFRPGLRISHDDFMENTNLAPRFAATFDIFGNGETLLIGGWNRYYGQTLLIYKLRESDAPLELENRKLVGNTPGPWGPSSLSQSATTYSRLRTPYSDERVLGIDQALFGGRLVAKYVTREGRDEFAREKDPAQPGLIRFARLNNAGRSHYESYQLDWERTWSRQYLNINAVYEESRTTNEDYDVEFSLTDFDERIWYDGRLLFRDEFPRSDFNRPYVVNLVYQTPLPWGFGFSNTAKFRSGYRNIEKTKKTHIEGLNEYPVYEAVKKPSTLIFDWKLTWTRPLWQGQELELSLDVYNVFNRRAYLGASDTSYEQGRQFWAGVEYRF